MINKQINIINTLHETRIRLNFRSSGISLGATTEMFFTHGGEMLLKLSNTLNSK